LFASALYIVLLIKKTTTTKRRNVKTHNEEKTVL
jgi:hypothetical protein